MPVPERVCAVVVTYNRREMLVECLRALQAQSRAPDRILVVDNASTDGTPKLVRSDFPDVDLLALEENVGGAGGFYEGMRAAHADGADWLWLMDDDTIASLTALEALLAPVGGLRDDGVRPQIMMSRVVWRDGTLHPMNIPRPETRRRGEAVDAAGRGLLLIRTGSFASILVHRDALDEHGLPHREYFIWNDDFEYTARVLRNGAGYLVPESVVEHRTRSKYTPLEEQGPRFYYEVRNKLLMLRGDSWTPKEKLDFVQSHSRTIWHFLRSSPRRREALSVVLRGLRDGLLGRTP
jgi:rhamnopyranosyl-N-acetylglucosaminyl-diphospho-decaprenol beta-1,3/1,4-galactofuranosyltransferase